jgi:hypothetical protein
MPDYLNAIFYTRLSLPEKQNTLANQLDGRNSFHLQRFCAISFNPPTVLPLVADMGS